MGKHFPRLVAEAEATLQKAQSHAQSFSSSRIDLTMFNDSNLLEEAWDAADMPMRRDLLRVAIDKITVTRAARGGAAFDGIDRCTFEWATPSEE
jgi:hypothetical protein